ncbi:MAG: hypothetical protein L0Y58_06330 [Verrucomicrobia subdivision 3 bacterium]|nr:hypothetical protein [Limisphaerales bacterium]
MGMEIELQTAGERKLLIPWDLSEWIERTVLRAWVDEEVGSMDWSNPELIEFLRANPNYRPREVLTLLGYAYATGVYESEEISRLCVADKIMREICAGHFPSTRALERFRRDNRGLLKWVLAQILKRAFRAHYNLQSGLLAAGLKHHLVQLAVERLDLARHMDRATQGA